MFTPDGELRPDFEPEEPTRPEPAAAPPPPPPKAAPPPPPERPRADARPAASDPPAAEARDAGGAEIEAEDHVGEGEPPPAGEPRGEFSAIVRSLATTAYAALGLLGDPSGARRPEPAVARQMIDWLAVLESKTRNNLSFEESDFLGRVLYELRLAFVEVTRPAGR